MINYSLIAPGSVSACLLTHINSSQKNCSSMCWDGIFIHCKYEYYLNELMFQQILIFQQVTTFQSELDLS